MAIKRMFSLSVVDTDNFLEMPISTRLLYYELGMRADDDGFVGNIKKILAFTGLTQDDLKVLISKEFVIPFESGVILIKHWRLNNNLQKDRIKPTIYQEELNKIKKNDNGVYELETTCIQPVYKLDESCVHSIDKYSIDKYSIDKYSINTIVHSSNARECFEKLWSEYPRKEGKANAFKKFEKLYKKNGDEIVEVILEGINKYKNYIQQKNIEPKYIKMGSSWFNQECWNDEYETENNKDVKIEMQYYDDGRIHRDWRSNEN